VAFQEGTSILDLYEYSEQFSKFETKKSKFCGKIWPQFFAEFTEICPRKI
jgi:hypothetical protein